MVSNRLRTGERLLRLGRFEEALACFAACLAEEASQQALFGAAVALHRLERFDQAEQRYRQVLANDSAHEEALSNLVAMHVEKFDLERVEHYSRRLLEVNGDSQVALKGLLVAAVERREYETAGQYFSRIAPEAASGGDAIEYRLSPATVERLRSHNGALTNPY